MRKMKNKSKIVQKVDAQRLTEIEIDEPTVLHLNQEISIKIDSAETGKRYEVRVWNDDPRGSAMVYEFVIKPTQTFPVKDAQ
jgi:hypothetical protein